MKSAGPEYLFYVPLFFIGSPEKLYRNFCLTIRSPYDFILNGIVWGLYDSYCHMPLF